MKVITIGREFGSGGRELGKRLAEALNISYYDKELIELIAQKKGFENEGYAYMYEKLMEITYPATIGKRFVVPSRMAESSAKISEAQQMLIKKIALQGDCVIVGRCADIMLKDLNPMNLFVYADFKSKIERCISRANEAETISSPQMIQRMKQIDKERKRYRELITETKWGEKEAYHLCINTTEKEIKSLIPALANYALSWFEVK